MRVAISGCRDKKVPRWRLNKVLGDLDVEIEEILVGDCPTGIDRCVRDWGAYPTRVFPADWETHGKAAGPIRNRELVLDADVLIAFWDGASRGTLSAIREALRVGVDVRIFSVAEGRG